MKFFYPLLTYFTFYFTVQCTHKSVGPSYMLKTNGYFSVSLHVFPLILSVPILHLSLSLYVCVRVRL